MLTVANFNISSLFGGLSSGNSMFSSFNFSDYYSIRSGAYKKLISKYYSGQNDTTSSKTDKTQQKQQAAALTKDTTGLTKMKKESDDLKASVANLSKDELWKQTNGEYDIDKIVSAVKSFASDYNDVLDQSSKVSTREVSQQTGFMTSLTNTMTKSLAKVGVTIGSDGKMSVNEDTLKKADMSNVKSLFSGNYSYASQVADKASAITSAANRSSSLYSSNGTYSSAISNMYNFWA